MSEVEPSEDDGLPEPKPVGEIKEDTLEVSSSPRERGTHYTLRRSIKPPRR